MILFTKFTTQVFHTFFYFLWSVQESKCYIYASTFSLHRSGRIIIAVQLSDFINDYIPRDPAVCFLHFSGVFHDIWKYNTGTGLWMNVASLIQHCVLLFNNESAAGSKSNNYMYVYTKIYIVKVIIHNDFILLTLY